MAGMKMEIRMIGRQTTSLHQTMRLTPRVRRKMDPEMVRALTALPRQTRPLKGA